MRNLLRVWFMATVMLFAITACLGPQAATPPPSPAAESGAAPYPEVSDDIELRPLGPTEGGVSQPGAAGETADSAPPPAESGEAAQPESPAAGDAPDEGGDEPPPAQPTEVAVAPEPQDTPQPPTDEPAPTGNNGNSPGSGPAAPAGVPPENPSEDKRATGQALIDKARKEGTVRVIVGLAIPGNPPGGPQKPADKAKHQAEVAAAQAEVLDSLKGQGQAEVTHVYETFPALALNVDEKALKHLMNHPRVTGVIEDGLSAPALNSTLPVIDGDLAHAQGYKGSGQIVVILDTGIDSDHPYFTGRIIKQACFSFGSGVAGSRLCANGLAVDTTSPDAADYSYCGGVDDCNHGTHVAGIAAGNNATYTGVAPDAEIIAIQVFSKFTTSTYCGTSVPCALSWDTDQLAALEYVYDTLRLDYPGQIAAVNMSLGGGGYTSACGDGVHSNPLDAPVGYPYDDAIFDLKTAGIATVIATGNYMYTDAISFPACIAEAIAVSASDNFDNRAWFANIDTVPPTQGDLFAPGYPVVAAYPDNTFASLSGTSMAAPHVTGAWALIKESNPTATVDQILSAFQTNSAVTIMGVKRIDVDDTLNAISICANITDIPQSECEALRAIYQETDGPNWLDNTNWMASMTVCGSWYGVICDGGNTTVVGLHLGGNFMTGELPDVFVTGLPNLTDLNLSGNYLTGTIPDLPPNAFTMLYLEYSAFTGSAIVSPTSGPLIGFRFNALVVSGAAATWLDTYQSDWRLTQTVAPTNVTATGVGPSSIEVNWTAIDYVQDGGGYEVSYAKDPAGPWTVAGMTADKYATTFTITGLQAQRRYWVRVRTFTPSHSVQPNDLWSDYTASVQVDTPPIKQYGLPSDLSIAVTGSGPYQIEVTLTLTYTGCGGQSQIEQAVVGTDIFLTIYRKVPPGKVCTPTETDVTLTFTLDGTFAANTYTLYVNDANMGAFGVP